MELEVYWLRFAENKLFDIYDYYQQKVNKKVAKRLIQGIVEATSNLGKQPKSGQIEIYLEHRQEEFRYLVYKNYKIVYWVNDRFNRVEIVNVFDARQHPEKMNEIS